MSVVYIMYSHSTDYNNENAVVYIMYSHSTVYSNEGGGGQYHIF